ncbi:hypothetical protein ACFWAY_47965 [Rhodococcus sp. NPDC059968]|uniref:hypothetical protein n=1 Tax=Rhodococcus sp. NPDC059968 TaxID=3347017 RepID=UPI00366D050B
MGTGKFVQWLVSPKIWNRGYLGLAHGIDSLLWRAIAWAAPKPFIMNALPPYVRFRFDDCNGHWKNPSDLAFVDELNKMGHIPSICFCFKALTAEGIAHVSRLQKAGRIDLAPHTYAPAQSFFYGDHNGEYTTEQLRSMFAELDEAKEQWGVRWSTILSDHEHETSANAIPFIRERGFRHKMNILLPGQRWTDPHTDWHPAPYGSMSYALDYLPGELSDFFAVFNHDPSFDSARVYTTEDNIHFNYHRRGGYGRQKWDFLNGLVAGPEPENKDLVSAADRLAEHTQIGLDALFFGGSITHSHFTRHLAPGEMTRIIEQADSQLRGLEQIPASYDEIADYAEAHANTEVVGARSSSGTITVDLTGRSWRDLRLSVYDDIDGVLVRSESPLPAFDGTTTVTVEPSTVS